MRRSIPLSANPHRRERRAPSGAGANRIGPHSPGTTQLYIYIYMNILSNFQVYTFLERSRNFAKLRASRLPFYLALYTLCIRCYVYIHLYIDCIDFGDIVLMLRHIIMSPWQRTRVRARIPRHVYMGCSAQKYYRFRGNNTATAQYIQDILYGIGLARDCRMR